MNTFLDRLKSDYSAIDPDRAMRTLFISFFLMNSLFAKEGIDVLYSFDGSLPGANPQGTLTLQNTRLYGYTQSGGINDNGVVFKLDPDGSHYFSIHYFSNGSSNGEGNHPYHGALFPVTRTDGNFLCGAALEGGDSDNGTIFTIAKNGISYDAIHQFDGTNGASPYSPPIKVNSKLYGITSAGGTNDQGVIYKVDLDGANYEVLYNFALTSSETGSNSHGELTLSKNKKDLYGMTKQGGLQTCTDGCGVIFKLKNFKTNPVYVPIHEFGSRVNDGSEPDHGYLLLERGRLYGLTAQGGVDNGGVIFSLDPEDGTYKLLHKFGEKNSLDGLNPYGSLAVSKFNILYGMTKNGGEFGHGTIFQILPDGTHYKVLASFNGVDGANPIDNVTISEDGRILYGMTSTGGAYDPTLTNQYGTIFSLELPLSTFPAKAIAKLEEKGISASLTGVSSMGSSLASSIKTPLQTRITAYQTDDSSSDNPSHYVAAVDPFYAITSKAIGGTPMEKVNFDLIVGYQGTTIASHENIPGLKENSVATALLCDVRIGKNWYIGEAIGYENGTGTFSDHLGKATVDGVVGSLYTIGIFDHFFTSMITSFTWDFFNMQRNSREWDITLQSYPQAYQIDADGIAGYAFKIKNTTITPLAGLYYSFRHNYSFQEKGKEILNIHVDSFNINSLQSLCGLRFAKKKNINGIQLLFEVEGDWEYEMFDQSTNVGIQFILDDFAFSSFLPAFNRNLFVGTMNLAAIFSPQYFLELSFITQYSPNNVLACSVSGIFNFSF